MPLVKEKLSGEELEGKASRFRSSLPRSSNKPFYKKNVDKVDNTFPVMRTSFVRTCTCFKNVRP